MEARAHPVCGAAPARGRARPGGSDRRLPAWPLAAQQQPRSHPCPPQSLPRDARSALRGRPTQRLIHRTAVYGPVRTVVWEGRSREAPPYPDSGGRHRPTADAASLQGLPCYFCALQHKLWRHPQEECINLDSYPKDYGPDLMRTERPYPGQLWKHDSIRVIVVAVGPNTVTYEDLSRPTGVTRDSLRNFLAGFTRLKSPAR